MNENNLGEKENDIRGIFYNKIKIRWQMNYIAII